MGKTESKQLTEPVKDDIKLLKSNEQQTDNAFIKYEYPNMMQNMCKLYTDIFVCLLKQNKINYKICLPIYNNKCAGNIILVNDNRSYRIGCNNNGEFIVTCIRNDGVKFYCEYPKIFDGYFYSDIITQPALINTKSIQSKEHILTIIKSILNIYGIPHCTYSEEYLFIIKLPVYINNQYNETTSSIQIYTYNEFVRINQSIHCNIHYSCEYVIFKNYPSGVLGVKDRILISDILGLFMNSYEDLSLFSNLQTHMNRLIHTYWIINMNDSLCEDVANIIKNILLKMYYPGIINQ
jgi:hypothetical protein